MNNVVWLIFNIFFLNKVTVGKKKKKKKPNNNVDKMTKQIKGPFGYNLFLLKLKTENIVAK